MGVMEDRIRELVTEGTPLSDTKALTRAYKQKYQVQALERDVMKWAVRIGNERQEGVAATPETEVEEVTTVFVPRNLKNPTPVASFVPDSLMENVQEIREAVINAGGADTAVALGMAIEKAGGLENFRRAVKLLEVVNALPIPSKPQMAPIFGGNEYDRQNRESIERARESLKA